MEETSKYLSRQKSVYIPPVWTSNSSVPIRQTRCNGTGEASAEAQPDTCGSRGRGRGLQREADGGDCYATCQMPIPSIGLLCKHVCFLSLSLGLRLAGLSAFPPEGLAAAHTQEDAGKEAEGAQFSHQSIYRMQKVSSLSLDVLNRPSSHHISESVCVRMRCEGRMHEITDVCAN